ncbi:GNAT family N-acetyltransferase [Olivibacter sitiensis]|uniref:GNAT family N-acetyltransferase n=1 Tax=Olivibacter sitiensis TaxID=376470 RepID=UPI00048883AE|nr:GNAT family N-acetyltransferase [Olivibacter sitiensis]
MSSSHCHLVYTYAQENDLPFIVEVYNSTIAGRMVTADTEKVSIESKRDWLAQHHPDTRPLWIIRDQANEKIGWVSFQSFYGRPAYSGTAEISIYLHPSHRGKGYGNCILSYAIEKSPSLKIHTLLAFIFAHNAPSLALFEKHGFATWGTFPDVAVLDGIPRSLVILGIKTVPPVNIC